MTSGRRTGALATAGLLALLVLGALLVRAPAIPRLLPHAPEPDAYIVQLAQHYRGDPSILEHVDYAERYPVLLARVLALLPWEDARTAPDAGAAREPERALLAGASAPYVAGRWLVLVLSLLSIPGTWLVARRLSGERAAWIAAGLVATSFLHALFSTQARPHAAQAAFAVLAAWAAMRYVERASLARATLAVALAALSLSTLQIGAATLPPLALAGWLSAPAARRRILRAALLPLVAILAASWAYPFALRVDETGVRLGGKGAHEVDWGRADFGGFAELTGWLASHDPLLLLLAAGGLASLAVRWREGARAIARGGDAAIACGYVLPYLAFVGPLDEVFERFLLPLLPWIATLGALVVARLAGPGRPWFLPAAAALVLALPGLVVGRFARVADAPDSSELAARWIAGQADAASAVIVASPGLLLPLPFEATALRADMQDPSGQSSVWTQYQDSLRSSSFPARRVRFRPIPAQLSQRPENGLRAWLEAERPTLVVLERSKKNLFLSGARELSGFVVERGRLVERTPGVAPEIEALGVLHYQDLAAPVRRLFATERFGSAIEIWRLEW